VDLFDTNLEEDILEDIAEGGLYHFGRFRHSDGSDVLGRLQFTSILNSKDTMYAFQVAFVEWLRAKIPMDEIARDTMFVGVDCWGSVMAMHASIRTGSPCMSVLTKGKRREWAERRELPPQLFQSLASAKHIVLFCDVVSRGSGYLDAIATIERMVKPAQEVLKRNYWCVSLVFDEAIQSSVVANLGDWVRGWGTAVSKLRIPVVTDMLPSDKFIRPSRSRQ
jgi:hypothetical protein